MDASQRVWESSRRITVRDGDPMLSDTGWHRSIVSFPVLGLVKNGPLWAQEKACLFLSQSPFFTKDVIRRAWLKSTNKKWTNAQPGLRSDQTAYLGADGGMQAKRQSATEKQRTLGRPPASELRHYLSFGRDGERRPHGYKPMQIGFGFTTL